MEIHPVTKVIYQTFYVTIRDIAYFLLIYYGMLMSFAFSAMVLLGPDHSGYENFNDAFRNLQRLATNELSITDYTRSNPSTIKSYAKDALHILYLCMFKWLLTEAVFLGLILDR